MTFKNKLNLTFIILSFIILSCSVLGNTFDKEKSKKDFIDNSLDFDLTLEKGNSIIKNEKVKIQYHHDLKKTKDKINNNIKIHKIKNKIWINSINDNDLNKSATITFYNITSKVLLLKDGKIFKNQNILNYNNDDSISFNVDSFSTYELIENLISYYDLETGDDVLGNYNLTVTGATNINSGIIDKAYSFDGSNDYLLYNSYPTSTIKSIFVWVNRKGLNSNIDTLFDTSAQGELMLIWRGDSNRWIHMYDAQALYSYNSHNGTWEFVGLTYDYATGNLSAYHNGVIVGSRDIGTHSISNLHLNFGRQPLSANYLDGYLDEISIFDKVLTPNEVSDLYNNGLALGFPFIEIEGNGNITNPYNISDCTDLQHIELIHNNSNYEYFQLTNNIDCSNLNYTPIMNGSYFRGSFNGNGYTIFNVTTLTGGSNRGIFAVIDSETKIYNLNINKINITGQPIISGCLIGEIERINVLQPLNISNININDCYIEGSLLTSGSTSRIGGLIGSTNYDNAYNNGLYIENINITNTTLRGGGVGGIFGTIGTFSSLAPSNIKMFNIETQINYLTSSNYVGGIVGWLNTQANINTHLEGYYSTDTGNNSGIFGTITGGSATKVYVSDYIFKGNITGYSVLNQWHSCTGTFYLDSVLNMGNSSLLDPFIGVNTCSIVTNSFYDNSSYTNSSFGGMGIDPINFKLNKDYFINLTGFDLHDCEFHTLKFQNINYSYGSIDIDSIGTIEKYTDLLISINIEPKNRVCDCSYYEDNNLISYSFIPSNITKTLNSTSMDMGNHNVTLSCNRETLSTTETYSIVNDVIDEILITDPLGDLETHSVNININSSFIFIDCNISLDSVFTENLNLSIGNNVYSYTGNEGVNLFEIFCIDNIYKNLTFNIDTTVTNQSIVINMDNEVNPLVLNECPSNLPSLMLLMIPLLIGFIMMFMGFNFKIPLLHVVAGLFIFMSGYVFIDCNRLLGIFIITLGLMLIPLAFMMAFHREGE